jgi:PleD family two-component response regulator
LDFNIQKVGRQDLINLADELLYKAKKGGRDQIREKALVT